ncbi:type II secretion system protein [Ectothiorhodospira sp. PHS-1]|uniref:PilT/PilU family type 4a pilus ATPase n=1 Tax=Ectothiorhodospira sp. PHS-1 TaxID=519989 RepID=UPI00024A8771|nr:PilT/PilU family type 4a pilus ATPase [Ectothiorhodospira sp. PHS-1]EHQ51817.1 type II secretion system protein [Ectothiorhodospira sp. PHS-1]
MLIEPYLKLMAQKNASDLFFTTGASASVKIEGDIRPISRQPLQPGAVREMAYDIMDERQTETFERDKEMNLGISLEGLGRFRVNIYVQRGEVSMVIRFIKSEIPTIEQLKLPPVLKELVMHDNGLILVVGATGSGKSTTLASMIDHRNTMVSGHILTIEDPIEYSFTHKKSIIGQREVGLDTLSYDNALREAMREAPDMIMIGEVRDLNTMKAAIAYADTGHLALSTLHAVNANQALDRIINFFPPESKQQILMDLSLNLRGIVSQRLLVGKDGNRLPAVEVLVNTPYIAELIRKGEINAIKHVMEKGGSVGMQTFDQSLFELYKAGLVTLPEALAKADSRGDLEWRIHFGGGVKSLKKEDDDLLLPGDADPTVRGRNDGRKGFEETLRPLSETRIKE